jgi:hypothetical protein
MLRALPQGVAAEMDKPETRTADNQRPIRADCFVADETLSGAERIAPTPAAHLEMVTSSTCAMTSVKAFVAEGRRQPSPTFIHVAIP